MKLPAKSPALLLVLVAVAVSLAVGCGGDDDGGTAKEAGKDAKLADAGEVTIEAAKNGDLRFEPDKLTAKPGQLTIVFINDAPTQHSICVEDGDGNLIIPEPFCDNPVIGGANAIAEVKPGEYIYYCDVDGHREQGMQGTLTVE